MEFTADLVILSLLLMLGAILYTSVGHGGASAYIAIMSLFGLPVAVIRPTALTLNIVVTLFSSYRFIRAGFFDFKSFAPIAIGAIPAAFIGGYLGISGVLYKVVVGVVLLLSSVKLLMSESLIREDDVRGVPTLGGIASGAGIGFLSGLTGTGGGIFLSPLLIFLKWTSTKTASGVACVFILANSTAGLLGNLASVRYLPVELVLFVPAVLAGALIGTHFGIRRFSNVWIRRALGVVLLVAGAKLVSSAF